jgi:hypothetical protein
MDSGEFDKRLLITYLDEVRAYELGDYFYDAVVSMTATKENYISNIEKGWVKIRTDNKVPDGVCLHFTDIKALLSAKYYNRPLKERNIDMERIFCDSNSNVLPDKLYQFYCDVLELIKKNKFVIQITGERYSKDPFFSNKKVKQYVTGTWYPIFRKHLDTMAYYLIKLAYDDYNGTIGANHNAKFNTYMAKLRYDGDFDLSVRNDFRNAFSHSISNGTIRFTADAVKACFDEVRFIDKSEIGFCVSCKDKDNCNTKQICHAGNEIIDFITAYAARYIAKDTLIEDYKRVNGKSTEEAEQFYKDQTCIRIEGKPDIEIIDVIKEKIYHES